MSGANKSPRVAVLFFGLTGSAENKHGEGIQLDPRFAAQSTLDNLIRPNQADVFIHSWSHENRALLEELYEPKAITTEEKPEVLWRRSHRFRLFWWLKVLLISATRGAKGFRWQASVAKNSFSRYQSQKRVVELFLNYCKDTESTYDVVFFSRLDLVYFSEFKLPELPTDRILVSNWNWVSWKAGEVEFDLSNDKSKPVFMDLWFGLSAARARDFSMAADRFFRYNHNQHRVAFSRAKEMNLSPVFLKYRGQDYELARRILKGEQI